ncbi:hypothetical protein DTO212C5_1239 [Paecilomyces variotii]|nr:hypothetical protein DTO212C5_1239 [Paecilomyces variotii]
MNPRLVHSRSDFGVGRVTKQLDSLWPTGLHHSNHLFVHYWGRRDTISSIMLALSIRGGRVVDDDTI